MLSSSLYLLYSQHLEHQLIKEHNVLSNIEHIQGDDSLCAYTYWKLISQKISFLHAIYTKEAIKRLQRVYTQYAVQVPSHVREVHTNEKVILDIRMDEVHYIGDNNMLRKRIHNLMHLNALIKHVLS